MKISGKQIKILVEKIFADDKVYIPSKDHYWNIDSSEIYNVYNQPKKLDIGQVTEDWNELLQILENKREPILFHDLEHLSQVLRAIAESEK